MVETIITMAMNDRTVLRDVKKAVQNAYKQYRKDTLREMDGDYRAFERHMVDEIERRRAPVPERTLGDMYGPVVMASESDLRKKVIRLAHAKPELRKALLPLVLDVQA